MPENRGTPSRLSPLYAACIVAGLAAIEPALGRLERLGDTLDAKQYLLIMPAGELSYLFPQIRNVSVRKLGTAGCAMLLAGLIPAVARLRRKGLDLLAALGWAMVASATVTVVAEYSARAEWVLLRRIGARYLAFAMFAVGSFLGCRDRRFLATLGRGGFAWDLSSAIFWAFLRKDLSATVPVPWYHHFEQEEGSGAPCWLVALADMSAILFFTWLARSEYDPLRLFDEPLRVGAIE